MAGGPDIDWEQLAEEPDADASAYGPSTGSGRRRSRQDRRHNPILRERKTAKSGPKLKKRYPAGYNTTRLEKLIAVRGQDAAKKIALQRGKTLVTKKRGDEKRAQVATSKTFDGIDIVDNYISYDKNLVVEPQNISMAAQFGNFQAESVMNDMGGQPFLLTTYHKCPL